MVVQYVSVLTLNVKPDDFAELSREVVAVLQRKAPAIPLATLVEGATSFEVNSFEPVAVVRP